MVGRAEALEGLKALLEASGEHGRTALISGEAGIGKSRLASELARVAEAAGRRVRQAHFFEQDEGIPYSAISRLLKDIAATDDGRTALSPFAGDLMRVEPSLAGIAPAGSARGSDEEGAAAEKRRVLDALTALVAALSAGRPHVIVFEDLHWADDSSLDATLQLARAAIPGCLLVLTYRSDEVTPALGSLLAHLDRERLASEVTLGPLTLSQVERMLRAIVGGRGTRGDLLHVIHQLAEGNPFFVEEVLRSLADQAGGLDSLDSLRMAEIDVPRSVNEAVRRRTQGLSERARNLLSLAAVAGTRFEFPLLRDLSGLRDEDILGLVKELIAAQVVIEEAEDVFAFRHALTREAVCAGMLLRERRGLSRRIAEAMERLYADDLDSHFEDLALHYWEASEWGKALEYSTRAAERALSLYAPASVLHYVRRAMEAAAHVPGAPTAPLLLLSASAHDILGSFDEARAAYEQAAADAATAGDERSRWRAVLDLGLLWASRDYARTGEYYREAVELARDLDDPRAVAMSLNRLGNWYSNVGSYAEARRLSEEALGVFRASGDDLGEAQTLDLLAMACYQGGALTDGARYYREALPRLEAAGDLRTLTSALASIQIAGGNYQTDIFPAALSLQEARGFGERAVEIARRTGWRSAESYALWQLAFCLGPQGEYTLALQNAREALAIAREIGHSQWTAGALCALGAIYLDLLKPEQARGPLEEAMAVARETKSDIWVTQSANLLSACYLSQKRLDLARKVYASVPEMPLDGAGGFAQRWYHSGAVEIELAAGDNQAALDRALRMEALVDPEAKGRTIMRIARYKGLALIALGRTEEGLAELETGRAEAEAHGHLSLLWRLHADLARALLAAGERDRAREHASAALAVVEGLSANVPEDLRASFVEGAAGQLPAPLRRRTTRDHIDALTAREAEIATLIARGLTNREIADDLVLSVRTVETHVANAMAKMGFSNRSQLAAWAVEHGLTAES
jgi:DNA-binding CsgD family transcriptional regulator